MIALAMFGEGELTLGVGISLGTLGDGCTSLDSILGDSISFGGLDILSKVTLCGFVRGVCCSVDGILFSILTNVCNAFSAIPLLFLFCFRAFVKSFKALTIVSSGLRWDV
jgi:hypothetical protein